MARWPRDRLVGLAAAAEGEVVTVPMPAGRDLHINADASGGRITAAVLDESSAVVQGFESGRCVAQEGDSLDDVFEWEAERGPHDEPGGERSIRLKLRNAELFSIWFSA